MNQKQKTAQTEVCKPCLVYEKLGIEKHSEMLPDNSILIKVIHNDGKICEFVEYPSITTFFNRKKRRERDPKMMDCPQCGQEGRIGTYRGKQFDKWKYYIAHEQIEGYWGKNHKIKKRRRCYIKTQDQINHVLKILGRYRS
jgi:hypothetical protein